MTDEREMRERAIEAFKCDMCAGSGQLMHYERNHGPCHKCQGVGHDNEGVEKALAFAVAERDLFTKILDLVATDELFIQPAEGGGWVFWVNVNDMFYPASDGEGIDISEIPALWQTWKENDWPGVVRWVQDKRGGLKLRKSREETICNIEVLQKQIKDLTAERDAEMERCCQAICSYCRDGILLDGDSHRYESGVFMDVCRARMIRSRVAAKEKP